MLWRVKYYELNILKVYAIYIYHTSTSTSTFLFSLKISKKLKEERENILLSLFAKNTSFFYNYFSKQNNHPEHHWKEKRMLMLKDHFIFCSQEARKFQFQ